MDEFDAFASPAETTEEADPAADFLAREQSELAGLEEFGEPSEPVQDLSAGGGLMEEDAVPAMTTEVSDLTGGMDQLGIGGDDGFSQEQVDETNEPVDMYSAITQQDTERAEPEKLRVWREEHTKRLEQKDAAEEKEKDEWRQKAKKELDDWYKHHAEQLQKRQETNREAEEAFIKDRDEKIPGQAWEKVTRLCEFNPKNSKTTKDVSRMRSILLQLKQTPLVR